MQVKVSLKIGQSVRRKSLIMEASVRSQVSPCENGDGQVAMGEVFLSIFRFFPSQNNSTKVPYSFSSTWGVQVLRYPNFFLGNGSR